MHRCWQIPEILQIILEELKKTEPMLMMLGKIETQAVARMARTCRTLSDPALNVLWSQQDTLLPLLTCFPSNLWEISGSNRAKTFRFVSAVSPSDWDRVLLHAARIRDLSSGWDVSLDTVEVLDISTPARCLLPNVRKLSWRVENATVLPYVRLFLGPHLTSISLSLGPTLQCLSLLSYIATNFRSLSEIEFSTIANTTMDDTLVEAMSAFVLGQKSLRILSMPHLRSSACQNLAVMTNLEDLTIWDFEGLLSPPDHQQIPEFSFSALRRLSMSTENFSSGTNQLLTTLAHTPLRHLDCVTDDTPTRNGIQTFFASLSDHCSHPNLEYISAQFGYESGVGEGDLVNSIIPQTIRPLLAFHNLRVVIVSTPPGFALDDAFCVSMAQAWPRVEHLQLFPGGHAIFLPSTLVPSTVSITALAAFASHCPQLADMRLEITALNPPRSYPLPDTPRAGPQKALANLDVLYSPIEEPDLVARFLSAIFPSLSITTFWRADPDDDDAVGELMASRWAEVTKLIPILAATRSDEERYWKAQLTAST
ncbi:hypothetical protein DFH06DRAFT_1130071 [Mycena polygramma]|nr:hypothetical protein DFH06DRAFT_1130071 [Mycena polygramma]